MYPAQWQAGDTGNVMYPAQWQVGDTGNVMYPAQWQVGDTGNVMYPAQWQVGDIGNVMYPAQWQVGDIGNMMYPAQGWGVEGVVSSRSYRKRKGGKMGSDTVIAMKGSHLVIWYHTQEMNIDI